jgi:hypothetical protein
VYAGDDYDDSNTTNKEWNKSEHISILSVTIIFSRSQHSHVCTLLEILMAALSTLMPQRNFAVER